MGNTVFLFKTTPVVFSPDLVSELQSLMANVPDAQWQHPSDFTRRYVVVIQYFSYEGGWIRTE